MANPWDLGTALGEGNQTTPASVHPGDTIWLRGGTYGSGGSLVYSYLSGTASSPICVRQAPHERATLDYGLAIMGNYTWYWGFEVENTQWTRTTTDSGSGGPPGATEGILFSSNVASAIGNKVINLVVHDEGDAIDDGNGSVDSEIYGNVLYNTGWSAPDRGHGHHLYVQNSGTTAKLVRENIGYNSFDAGLQEYGASALVSHIHADGNVMFNSGLPYGHRTDNVIVQGGAQPKEDISFSNQIAYDPLDADPSNSGYSIIGDGSANLDLTITDSYWIGTVSTAYPTLSLTGWQTLTFTGNTVVGGLSSQGITTNTWSHNAYFNAAPPASVDPQSPVTNHYPTGVKVIVRPNYYELGRANIVVLDWDKNPMVSVDISGIGLPKGTKFEVRDVQNFFGTPVLTGTYDGSPITLPMNLSDVSQLIGFSPTPAHTSSEFNAFVLMPD